MLLLFGKSIFINSGEELRYDNANGFSIKSGEVSTQVDINKFLNEKSFFIIKKWWEFYPVNVELSTPFFIKTEKGKIDLIFRLEQTSAYIDPTLYNYRNNPYAVDECVPASPEDVVKYLFHTHTADSGIEIIDHSLD